MNEGSKTSSVESAKPDRGFLPLLVRAAVPLGVLGSGVAAYLILSVEPRKAQVPPATQQAIRTRVSELRVREYPVVIKTHGIVRSHDEVALSAQVSGLITHFNPAFEAGSYFAEGDVLVELEANDYRIAVAVAEARLLGSKAALQLATLNHERNLKVFSEKLIPEAEVDRTSAVRSQAAAEVDSATAQVERANRDLQRTQIRAPFAGRVRQKSVGLGQSVGPGTPLGTVFAVDFAEVRLPIAGRELQFLDLPERAGDSPLDVELRDAVNGASKTSWKAKIIRTEGALDANSLELFAIARVEDPFGLRSGQPPLRIGQPVTASIAGKTLTNVVALPRQAVRQLDQVVFVNRATLTLKPMTVVPVWSDEESIIVPGSALDDGLLLAMTHLVYAPNGAKVEIIPDITLTNTTVSATNTTKRSVPADSDHQKH
ncbi:MAG: Multidrug resistance protein MdtA precursor [Verrucomicrobiota bacterium]|jgi:RND family efflux transporter MFP subunit